MKKMILALLCSTLFATACSNESTAVNNAESLKTTEMKNLDNALKSLVKVENRSTPEEKARLGAQLNDKSLDILYNASKQFLTVQGNKIEEARNRESKELVISKATKLYFEKLGKINTAIKSEN